MNLLDEEVFATLLAIVVIGSVISIAQILRPDIVEPFVAFGLLNEECKIGEYPRKVFPGQNLTLCLYVYNNMGYPILAQVRYKIGNVSTIPTNNSPSSSPTVKTFEFLVDNKGNITRKVLVPITIARDMEVDNITLIFELWLYDTNKDSWVYSGRWTHIHVEVVKVPVP